MYSTASGYTVAFYVWTNKFNEKKSLAYALSFNEALKKKLFFSDYEIPEPSI